MKWLRAHTSPRVGLRPHREVELEMGFDDAYERVRGEIETTLGANIYVDDRSAKLIEAGFGVVNNERIRVTFDRLGGAGTKIYIEACFRPGALVPEKSAAVDALAKALARSTTP